MRVVPRIDGGIDLVPGPVVLDRESQLIGPTAIGIIVDDQGHVAVPYFVEKEDVGDKPIRVFLEGGQFARAKFIGSDQKSNLTVLKLEKPSGKPLRMDGIRPNDGSLVLAIGSSGESAQWAIWTGGMNDSNMIVGVDGAIAGFTRYGQFLSARSAMPIVKQLITHGSVRRAVLGVVIAQTEGPNGRVAVQIARVYTNSAAEKAGLRQGDFVVSVGGVEVIDIVSFGAAIADSNGPTSINIIREGKGMQITADLKPQ